MFTKTSFVILASLLAPLCMNAQNTQVCPRFAPGSTITAPEDLFSKDGVLAVNLTYQTTTDQNGNTLFCFTDSNGAQSPTLHVNPGDRIAMSVTNQIAGAQAGMTMPAMKAMSGHPAAHAMPAGVTCGSTNPMNPASVNVHFHGTNTAPSCHQDEVILTLINPGETFDYNLDIPADEPPGLYWYHPHVHGISEPAVQGGASGAIVVEGIQNVVPAVAGLTQQLLIVRDNPVPGAPTDPDVPSWDLSLNYIPIPYPVYTPAVLTMKPGEKQLWRVLNASADSILDLQVQYDGTAQNLTVVAMDGVPSGSQDGTAQGRPFTATDILLAPAARAEFVVTGPAATVGSAMLMTLNIDTGPAGDADPQRPLATIQTNPAAPALARAIPSVSAPAPTARFVRVGQAVITAQRTLYFSEIPLNPSDPDSGEIFYITVNGQLETAFDPNNPPAIVTTQGAVEDWTIENHTMEVHEFHIHQIHFLTMAQNGVPVANPQFLDTVQVPYWTGTGPYPSVTLRMDFRGAVVGDFLYHCHILAHEDAGMMATIRVNPAIAISTVSLPPATTGVPYMATLQATGGTGSYTWSVISGTLPAGLSLDSSTGNITGVPTSSGLSPGVSSTLIIGFASGSFKASVTAAGLVFQAEDSSGAIASANLPISVAPPIVIAASAAPAGNLGVPYSFCVLAQGGDQDDGWLWTVTTGSVPPGISLSFGAGCPHLVGSQMIAIAGIPTQAGSFTFTLQASDPEGRSAQQSYTIMIGTAPPAAFFTGEILVGGGAYYLQFPDGNLFGYYNFQYYPFLFHYDLGFEYFVDGHHPNADAFLYDFASGHWFYTSPGLFPYLYDFALKNWLYYFPDPKNPGHYTTNPRYFGNLGTGTIFTM